MAKRKRPSVSVNCVADKYSGRGERIVEFTFLDGKGGLISFGPRGPQGVPTVELYRVDPGVAIVKPKKAVKRGE